MTDAGTRESLSFADLPGLMAVMSGDAKHDHSAASTLDVLWVLYDQVLRVSPDSAADDDRDRFLLSKGHAPKAFYAVLTAKGFIGRSELQPRGDRVRRRGRPGPADRDRGGQLQLELRLAAALSAPHPGTPGVVVAVIDPGTDPS